MSNTFQTALRRKAPVKTDSMMLVVEEEDPPALQVKEPAVVVAKVKRRYCGTGPFDKHWLNIDCCGLFCAFITYCLHAYGVYAVCFILVPPWMSYFDDKGERKLSTAGVIHTATFSIIALLAVISHYKAMTTDPGSVPPDATPLPEEMTDPVPMGPAALEAERRGLTQLDPTPPVKRICRRCKAYKPHRAHHCSVCKRCIIKMDHHCPWVNNCVGIGNHKYFLLFVFYTCISCFYSMSLIIARTSTCMDRHRPNAKDHNMHPRCLDSPGQLLNILGLLIEALLFGLFTMCMMCDQSGVIHTKLTHIDRLKGTDIGGSLAGIQEVFGVGKNVSDTRFRFDWLWPFAQACFPSHLRDEMMGFCQRKREKESNGTRILGSEIV